MSAFPYSGYGNPSERFLTSPTPFLLFKNAFLLCFKWYEFLLWICILKTKMILYVCLRTLTLKENNSINTNTSDNCTKVFIKICIYLYIDDGKHSCAVWLNLRQKAYLFSDSCLNLLHEWFSFRKTKGTIIVILMLKKARWNNVLHSKIKYQITKSTGVRSIIIRLLWLKNKTNNWLIFYIVFYVVSAILRLIIKIPTYLVYCD